MTWLGIDIGGTNTKVALLDSGSSSILEQDSVPTDRSDARAAVQRAGELSAEWVSRHPGIEGAGVTIPGHFDEATGRATIVPNIPGVWRDLPVRDIVASISGRPTTLINDARAFGLAESRLGAGRGSGSVVALVLGTGVGGAIILDGRLHDGRSGLAGEIGHMVLQADGPPCGCGNRGCLEALTRSDLLAARAGASTVADAVAKAAGGDRRALDAIEMAARWIGLALANVATLLAPDAIVLGGGIAQAGEVLWRPLREELLSRSPLLSSASYRLLPAELGTIAGAVGAAILAHDRRNARRTVSGGEL